MSTGKALKKIRLKIGISQDELAEKLNTTTKEISHIESGDADMDGWQFVSALELLGQPTDSFWFLDLDYEEFEIAQKYDRLKILLSYEKFDEARDILLELEKSKLSKRPFIKQFIAHVKIIINKDIPHEKAMDELFAAIRMSIPDFDENKIAEYDMNYNELYISTSIANILDKIGERDRSIALAEKLIENKENFCFRISEKDEAALLTLLMKNLSTSLRKKGKIQESLKISDEALRISRESQHYKYIPLLLHNVAHCQKALGEDEEIYKQNLTTAYYCSRSMDDDEDTTMIKNDAEKNFGIIFKH